MHIKERIVHTLSSIEPQLLHLTADWCVIGAAAMILSDIDVGETTDIDILTTATGSEELQHLLRAYKLTIPDTKEDELFRSNFAQFRLPLMHIEVMGDLEIKKAHGWQPVRVQDFREVAIGKLTVKIPTVAAQKKLLQLFGREKDLRRVGLLERGK